MFETRRPAVAGNERIRRPQRECFEALEHHVDVPLGEREVGVVLPVGCGKSGCIALAPFAFRSSRTLVVAPNVRIAEQLYRDFDPSQGNMFYVKTRTLNGEPYPEPAEIRGTATNRSDLDGADVVITNIQQLQGQENRWLGGLARDYFDLILFDEGHHNVAATWETLRETFPEARIVNFSATPLRADGRQMAGPIIYSYPVVRAIQEGYVKRLKALVLNPRTLRYVRRDNGQEVEVSLDEVRRLGEEDADFRRSIVMSSETLTTIVDASIRELERIRAETSERRHKIIAAALNFEHCRQVVQAYRARNLRADYVHSREDSAANRRVFSKLENDELDVIVQVRKLGEGFDHPYLSVAAVFSIFSNLSPFVQFVGRIMRVIVQDDPDHPVNQGTVVFHAGANVARRWEDFQRFSEADQMFFDQLLPVEGLDFSNGDELQVVPRFERDQNMVEVRGQSSVELEEIPLIQDPEALRAVRLLQDRGYSAEDVRRVMELHAVPTTAQRRRQAERASLDMQVRTEVGRILAQREMNPSGYDLDRTHNNRTNFVVLKSVIDRRVNAIANHRTGERSEFTPSELQAIQEGFATIVADAVREIFGA